MTRAAFDVRQYRLLVGLLGTLGARRELTSQFGMNAPALGVIAAFALLLGGFLALAFSLSPPLPRQALTLCLTVTMFLLVPLLTSEAADALLNPAELSILAFRPIGDLTYLAAKITYLLRFALTVAAAINLPPALAGLLFEGVAWFYPITHLAAAALTAVFAAFAMCGIFGLCFRVVPASRVRSAALWAQLAGATALPAAPHLMRLLEIQPDLDRPYWSAIPLTWFAAMGLAGQPAGLTLDVRFALPSMTVAVLLVVAGARALTRNYMTRVSMAMRGRKPKAARATGDRLRPALVRLTGSVAGAGSVRFVVSMALRDWQFRREFVRAAIAPLIPLALVMFRQGARSPFATSDGFPTAHAIPHVLGLLLFSTSQFLAFSDHYRARWILQTVPASGLRGFVRGAVAALWLVGAVVPSVLVLTVGSLFWGARDAALFATYCLSVATLYLAISACMQAGLPFTRPPSPGRATSAAGAVMLFGIGAVVFAVFQAYVVFTRLEFVVVCTAAFAAAGWFGVRVSLRLLEGRVPGLLRSFTESSHRTFTAAADDA